MKGDSILGVRHSRGSTKINVCFNVMPHTLVKVVTSACIYVKNADVFLRNVGAQRKYTASYSTRLMPTSPKEIMRHTVILASVYVTFTSALKMTAECCSERQVSTYQITHHISKDRNHGTFFPQTRTMIASFTHSKESTTFLDFTCLGA
jgi:hypothetical protein